MGTKEFRSDWKGQNMRSEDKARVCSDCHRSDTTSFSKCRFCGTAYGANKGDASSQQKLMVSLCALIILVGAGYSIFTTINGIRTKQVTPVVDQVRRFNRSSKPTSSSDKSMRLRKLATN